MKFKFLKAALAGLVFLTIPVTTYAAPILLGPTTAATGISGLEIGGVVYDVAFSNAGPCGPHCEKPYTFPDEDDAYEATVAIASFLNGYVTGITDIVPLDGADALFVLVTYIPQNGIGTFAATALLNPTANASWCGNCAVFKNISSHYNSPYVSFATFTKTNNLNQVSAPPSVAILALGMIGLASRRFKKQS